MAPVAFNLFDGQPEWTEIALVIGVAFVVATIVATVLARLVRSLLQAVYGKELEVSPRLLARPVVVTRLVSFCLALFVTAMPLLDAIGAHVDVGLDRRAAFQWAVASGLRITIIVTIAWLMVRTVGSTVNRLELEIA